MAEVLASPPSTALATASLRLLRRDRCAAEAAVARARSENAALGAFMAVTLGCLDVAATSCEGAGELGCTAQLVVDVGGAALAMEHLQGLVLAGESLGMRAEGALDADLCTLAIATRSRGFVFDLATLHCCASGRAATSSLVEWLLGQQLVRHGVSLAALMRTFPAAFQAGPRHAAREVGLRWVDAASWLRNAHPAWPLGRVASQLGSLAAYALASEEEATACRRLGRRGLSVDATRLSRPLRAADVDALALRARLLVSLSKALQSRTVPLPARCPLQQARSLRPPCGRAIIDVGAQHGVCGRALQRIARERCGAQLPVVYVEPDEASIARIEGEPGDVLLCAACTSVDGWCDLRMLQPGTHSLLPPVEANLPRYIDGYTQRPATGEDWRVRACVPVQGYRLETICDALGIAAIEVLKIDTQGHDLEVLRSLGDRLLAATERVQCEVQLMDFELYAGATRHKELHAHMAARGFACVGETRQCSGQEANLTFERLARGSCEHGGEPGKERACDSCASSRTSIG